MVSALGLDAVTSCAAARAGVSRIVETDDLFVDDLRGAEVEPVRVHRVPRISGGLFGFSRLLRLGLAGMEDLLRSAPETLAGRTGLVLIVNDGIYQDAWSRKERRKAAETTAETTPEVSEVAQTDGGTGESGRRAEHDRIVNQLLATLVTRLGIVVDTKLRITLAASSVGLVSALRQADAWLTRRECDRCIVGGIDSLVDPAVLAAIEGLGLLKTPNRAAGMLPGEAACFLACQRPQDVQSRREPAAAFVEAQASASEAAHPLLDLSRPDGGGLLAAIREAARQLPDQGASTGLAVANLNGDPYRAASWGRCVMPDNSPLRLGALPFWIPPLHFGDIGAAAGPVSLAMLVRGWARGWAPRPSAIVCLMDDAGARGAICVRAPEDVAA
ncbi:MAG: hypothetical protein JXP73_16720 [Deltaproteobacteria bacterium]|nr:hypothetical protein [Deltaproteobacteria bacterium]